MAIDLKETFFKFKEKVQSFNETKNKMIEVKTKRNEKRHTLNELIKEAKEHVFLKLFRIIQSMS